MHRMLLLAAVVFWVILTLTGCEVDSLSIEGKGSSAGDYGGRVTVKFRQTLPLLREK